MQRTITPLAGPLSLAAPSAWLLNMTWPGAGAPPAPRSVASWPSARASELLLALAARVSGLNLRCGHTGVVPLLFTHAMDCHGSIRVTRCLWTGKCRLLDSHVTQDAWTCQQGSSAAHLRHRTTISAFVEFRLQPQRGLEYCGRVRLIKSLAVRGKQEERQRSAT